MTPAALERKRERFRAWYRLNGKSEYQRERIRQYGKEWRARPETKPLQIKSARRYREKFRISRLVYHAINRAKGNGMECDSAFLRSLGSMRPETCPCCGGKIDYAIGVGPHPKYDGPSLDRVDTLKGYIPGNVEIICWRCNAIKRDATLAELEKIVSYMRSHLCGQ